MPLRPLALIVAAALVAGCVGNETKPAQPAPEQASAAPAPAPAAAPAKPECPPEPAKKKTATKKTTAKKDEKPLAPPDCEPAKAKTAAAPAPAAAPAAKPAAAATPAPAAAPATSAAGKGCNPCVVKSRDGTFEGEVYGTIPSSSKWAKLQIGMEQPEVERLLGVSHNVHAYPTAKAWIPFYYGTDRTRYEVRYPGQGSVSYTGGSWGGGQGVLMMINYDPSQQ
ncbi:MAG TPA: hypothetical protein VF096_01475 [Azonexus sp.]